MSFLPQRGAALVVFTAADTTLGSNGWRAGVGEAAPFLVLGTCSGSGVRATSPLTTRQLLPSPGMSACVGIFYSSALREAGSPGTSAAA